MRAIWIRAHIGVEWHRLTIVGVDHHGTACALGSVPTDEPVLLSADPPTGEPKCRGCERDLEVKRSRVPTADLRPRVWTGEVVDVEVAPALPRTATREW